MRIKYVTQQTGGKLFVHDATKEEADAMIKKLWNFVCTHRHHVLRPHYAECKIANVYQPLHRDQKEDGSFEVLSFFASLESHLPYVAILQRELKLDIEDVPTLSR